jgi:hypothetical protein
LRRVGLVFIAGGTGTTGAATTAAAFAVLLPRRTGFFGATISPDGPLTAFTGDGFGDTATGIAGGCGG